MADNGKNHAIVERAVWDPYCVLSPNGGTAVDIERLKAIGKNNPNHVEFLKLLQHNVFPEGSWVVVASGSSKSFPTEEAAMASLRSVRRDIYDIPFVAQFSRDLLKQPRRSRNHDVYDELVANSRVREGKWVVVYNGGSYDVFDNEEEASRCVIEHRDDDNPPFISCVGNDINMGLPLKPGVRPGLHSEYDASLNWCSLL